MSRIHCRCGWKYESKSNNRTELEVIADRHESAQIRRQHRHSTSIEPVLG